MRQSTTKIVKNLYRQTEIVIISLLQKLLPKELFIFYENSIFAKIVGVHTPKRNRKTNNFLKPIKN